MAASVSVVANGALFNSFNDLQETISEFEKMNFVKLYRRRARTIANALKRTPKRTFNPQIVYTEFEMCCSHGSRSTGKRPCQSTFQKGCQFLIVIRATEDGEKLMVKKFNAEHNHPLSSFGRTLLGAFREINTMGDRLNLPRMILDCANTLLKQVHESKSLKGRRNEAIAAACLYIACRQEGVPRTFKEICAVSKITKKDIGQVYKLISKTLGTSFELITTDDFMSRFCSNLSLPQLVQKAATHIARKAMDLDLVPGRSPISVAAAAIYMACLASDQKKAPKDIGEIAGVAEVTIRQSYKLMYPRAQQLFPEDFRFEVNIKQWPSN